MKRVVLGLGTAALALAATVGVAVADPGGSAAPRPSLVVQEQITDIAIPADAKVGTPFTSYADITDTARKKIGETGGQCAIVKAHFEGHMWAAQCTSMWKLPGGQLSVSQLLPFDTVTGAAPKKARSGAAADYAFEGVVTGGSGKYRGARGEVRFSQVQDAPSGFFGFRAEFSLRP
ncbi:allene oxide cyclase barrel-like domain-containing protein [Streptomyces lydicus]|uniref:allene oxide cyclase barrel-like domain-containing protein n=1 Tax=Streptomyces lydicus TaxID=47763 RepID=UPI0034321DB6